MQQGCFFLSLFSCNYDDQLSPNFHRFVIVCIGWGRPSGDTGLRQIPIVIPCLYVQHREVNKKNKDQKGSICGSRQIQMKISLHPVYLQGQYKNAFSKTRVRLWLWLWLWLRLRRQYFILFYFYLFVLQNVHFHTESQKWKELLTETKPTRKGFEKALQILGNNKISGYTKDIFALDWAL